MDLGTKVALVTGAGSGIGRAIALRFASEGALVVVNDVNDAGGAATMAEIESNGGTAAFVHADVSNEVDVSSMVGFAEERFGGLDVLVNNAGVFIEAPYFPDAPLEHWGRVLDVYLRGVMLCIHAAVPALRHRGGGVIVNISSGAGIGFRAHDAPEYAAAKAGVARLTAALAPLARRDGIRVNCVCPGWVDTPASQRTVAAMTPDERRAAVPPQMRTPDEIADAVVQLATDETLAGRVMLYYEGEERRLLPVHEG
jgi:NAD(P)-dependent dehydrogenase (short-subunit alcohol dehydrogenase family)